MNDTRERTNLVLSRRPGETIEIGGTTVTVLRMRGNRVQLVIEAPRDIPIRRGELEPKQEAA